MKPWVSLVEAGKSQVPSCHQPRPKHNCSLLPQRSVGWGSRAGIPTGLQVSEVREPTAEGPEASMLSWPHPGLESSQLLSGKDMALKAQTVLPFQGPATPGWAT